MRVDVSGLSAEHFDALRQVKAEQWGAVDGRLMRVLVRRGFAEVLTKVPRTTIKGVVETPKTWKLTPEGRKAMKVGA